MRKSLYGLFVVLGLIGGFAFGAQNAAAQEVSPDDIRTLPGYKSYGILGSFTKQLRKNPELFQELQSNPALAEHVLSSTLRQRQILRQIELDGSISSVLREFSLNLTPAQKRATSEIPPTVDRAPEERAKRERRTNGNANLAAQAAIEAAQREKEAAEKRAEEMLADLEKQMEEHEQLANEDKARRELAASEARLNLIKAAFEGNPEAEAEFFANTALLQKVMDDEMTLDAALAEMDITLETPVASEPVTAAEEQPATEPKNQLVHVYGNKYRLNGRDIYDLNHIPEPDETALDENGWPKYLNVPDFCAPPDESMYYRHEQSAARISYGIPSGAELQRYSKGYGPDLNRGQRVDHYAVEPYHARPGNTFTLGLTKSEMIAAPFVTINASQERYSLNTKQQVMPMAPLEINYSLCPGDMHNKHLPDDQPACSTYGKLALTGGMDKRISYETTEDGLPTSKNTCQLGMNERYFINIWRARWDNGTVIAHNDSCKEEKLTRTVNGQEEVACGSLMVARDTRYQHIPYINRCLSQGPYPLNYRYGSCTRSNVKEFDRACTHDANPLTARVCYDPENILPPLELKQECAGGSRINITSSNQPIHSSYICERVGYREHPEGVCAAHREGDIRKLVLVDRKGSSSIYNKKLEFFEQCQFHENRQRFDWVSIGSKTTPHQGKDFPRYENASEAEAPDKSTCAMLGVDLKMGEQLRMTCHNHARHKDDTLDLTCQNVADASMHPALVDKNGFSFKRVKRKFSVMSFYGNHTDTYFRQCKVQKL